MKKGAIFDQDGLMFDTETIWQDSWHTMAENLGVPVPEGFTRAVSGSSGELMVEIVSRFFPSLDAREYINLVRERTHQKQKEMLQAKPGLYELLDYFQSQGVKMIVASSSTRDSIRWNLKKAGIEEYFLDVISGEDVTEGKPAPDIFLKAAHRLGLAPDDCYVLEDSYNGVRAGHRAGCYTIMVPDQIEPDEEISQVYDACVSSLLEVRDCLMAGQF
jgi:HAD superfamily hydrolase (TIGR01509 family)